eukprot:3729021-Alexandrium_andersonii.AAC.1
MDSGKHTKVLQAAASIFERLRAPIKVGCHHPGPTQQASRGRAGGAPGGSLRGRQPREEER